MTKKTKQMLKVEAEQGQKLEDLLPDLINERGQGGAAEFVGVQRASFGYWLLKLGINIRRVAVSPGDTVTIIKN